MSLTLYAHPFSSYCQKVLVALYENDVPFEYRTLEDPQAMVELKARWPFDRFFDNDVMAAMQRPVFEAIRKDSTRKDEARRLLELAYGWLEQRLEGRTWAAGENLSLADCAAAPSLFYADWVHPITDHFPTLRAYRSRLLAWPSFARAVDEARPYRRYFPLGAPDRD